MIIDRLPNEIQYSEEYLSCISSHSEYIPIQALYNGSKIKKGERMNLIYGLYAPNNNSNYILAFKSVKSFVEYFLRSGNYAEYRSLVYKLIPLKYYVNYGMLLFNEERTDASGVKHTRSRPLVVLCVKRRYTFKVQKKNPNPNHLCLVVSGELFKDVAHEKMWKVFKKQIIDPLQEEIDVVYTHSIRETCYNDNIITLPKFDTVIDMKKFMDKINDVMYDKFARGEIKFQ